MRQYLPLLIYKLIKIKNPQITIKNKKDLKIYRLITYDFMIFFEFCYSIYGVHRRYLEEPNVFI
jgi:hypothetical protein